MQTQLQCSELLQEATSHLQKNKAFLLQLCPRVSCLFQDRFSGKDRQSDTEERVQVKLPVYFCL